MVSWSEPECRKSNDWHFPLKCMSDLYHIYIDASDVSVSYYFNWKEINDAFEVPQVYWDETFLMLYLPAAFL